MQMSCVMPTDTPTVRTLIMISSEAERDVPEPALRNIVSYTL